MIKTITIDNFLDIDDHKMLSEINLEKVPDNSTKVYINRITKENVITESSIDPKLIEKLHLKYHNKVFSILKDLSPEKADLYDYSDFLIVKTGKNYKFPIHDDTPNKLLSGVIYLYPNKNTGTIFYSNKSGDDKKVVEWKQNRAVFFSRLEQKTWHSFEGDGNADRVVLVYNLVSTNLKKIFKIERKSYLLGLFRYKINPYLNKIFKKTI